MSNSPLTKIIGVKLTDEAYSVIERAATLTGFKSLAEWARIILEHAAKTHIAMFDGRLKCFRCNYMWTQLGPEAPQRCPECRSSTWSQEVPPPRRIRAMRSAPNPPAPIQAPIPIFRPETNGKLKTIWSHEWPDLIQKLDVDGPIDEPILRRVASLRLPGMSLRRFRHNYPTLQEQIQWLYDNCPYG